MLGIRRLVKDNAAAICEAVYKDLHRPAFESMVCEVAAVAGEVDFALANLDSWVAPTAVSTPLTQKPGSAAIHHEPFGVVLLIGPWNFPVSLLLQAMVAAFSAGNSIVLKPSEVSAHSSALLERLVQKYLDNDVIAVVQGAVAETTELLKQRFDHIWYTGNGAVGKIVMRAAAAHLTPVTLELGGKSPVIIDNSGNDLNVTARRILATKLMNNGQVCVAPDYILVHRSVHDELLAALKKVIVSWHGPDPQRSKDLSRMINERHFDRVVSILKQHSGDVAHGGKYDRDDLYIEPTILTGVTFDSPIMQTEIFGPVLPIIAVDSMDQAIELVRSRDKPLALYIFSKSAKLQSKVLSETSSGGVCINDTLMHLANPNLPFGGVGGSGMGSYHGKHGFDAFSHHRAVAVKPTWIDPALRYPPYTERKLKLINFVVGGMPTIPKPLLIAAAVGGGALWLRSRM